MASPIKDRFDTVPDDLHRVGAHRALARRGAAWAGLGWALLSTVVLIGLGLFALSLLDDDFSLPSFTANQPADTPVAEDPAEEAAPVLDPEIAITVLNGTPTPGLSNTVGDYLVSQGWGGAEVGIGSRLSSTASDVATTVVFYNDPANESAARAMVQTLGVGEVRLSNDYPASPIAVLVGADFVVPVG